MYSDQSFNLQNGDSLHVKTLIIGMLANGVWQKVENEMVWLWIDFPQAQNVCRELVKWGCKKGYTGRCKCLTSGLKYTELCQYFGPRRNGKLLVLEKVYWLIL